MRELPLAAEHERLGATFGTAAGWHVPVDYGDPIEEQRAVRAFAGIADWTSHGKVRVTGPDRLTFLDGVLTNDLKTLAGGHGLYAATLDHKAHIHGDMVVYDIGTAYMLEMEPEATESVLANFSRLLVSDDVTLEDATDEYVVLGLFGPRSGRVAANVVGDELPRAAYEHAETDRGVRIARSPYFGGDGFELWIPAARDPVSVFRALLDAGARPVGARAQESLRIEAGRPKYGVDMDERTLVLEARLEPAISMTKGCYVGQEIVSRATYQGHMNRLLVGLELEGDVVPEPGSEIHVDGKAVGTVTSAAPSAWRGRVLALGYVRRPHTEPGTEVVVRASTGLRARVAELPFFR